MQIIYPREYVVLPSGCVALLGRAYGSRSAGPLTKFRPRVKHDGEMWSGYRLSYHLNVAPIPRCPGTTKEGIICHHCDQEWCINPEHLYLGTAKQNVADIWKRHPTIRKIFSEARKGNQNTKGRKLSTEHIEKIMSANKGNQYAKGKTWKLTEEQKETHRKSWTEERKQAQSKRLKGNTLRRDHLASRKNNTESS